jgi:hypothetical protein
MSPRDKAGGSKTETEREKESRAAVAPPAGLSTLTRTAEMTKESLKPVLIVGNPRYFSNATPHHSSILDTEPSIHSSIHPMHNLISFLYAETVV